ncbi:hypothetical protein Leryth_016104 [Lithospermum erythrorhizon]|nr:hypothetical protein Leryth_016104 [Lithospermum erythrorhizon]
MFLLMLFVFVCYRRWNPTGKKRCSVPINWPVLGMGPGLFLNVHRVHEFITEILHQTGSTFEFHGPWFSNVDILVTCEPANIHYILSKKFHNFPKGLHFKEIFDVLGDGIFNAEAESWEIQRRITKSLLLHQNFRKFLVSKTLYKLERGLIPVLEHFAKLGIEVDLQELIQRFTSDLTCLLILDHDPGSICIELPNFPFMNAFCDAEKAILYRHVVPASVWKLQKWLNIGKERKMSEAEEIFDVFLTNCIASKREKLKNSETTVNSQEGYFDFLSSYMETLEERNGESYIPEKAWKDTLINLIFAGKDTIGSALTWFFYLMAMNPSEENRIREEISKKLHILENKSQKFPNVEALNSLVYLHGGLCETLRLYPPVALQHKAPIEADILPSGHFIKPNTKTVISFYSVARMEQIWGADCLEFKPERWISERGNVKHVPSFKFTAFNSGPRSCLGKEMSLLQMKIVAVEVLSRFAFEVVEGQKILPNNSVVLNMKHGLKVKVSKRGF